MGAAETPSTCSSKDRQIGFAGGNPVVQQRRRHDCGFYFVNGPVTLSKVRP
jgi:hypothetical protein